GLRGLADGLFLLRADALRSRRQLVDGMADGAHDGVAVQVVETGAALRILAGALRSARFFGRHLESSMWWVMEKICCRLPCTSGRVKSICQPCRLAAVDSFGPASSICPCACRSLVPALFQPPRAGRSCR